MIRRLLFSLSVLAFVFQLLWPKWKSSLRRRKLITLDRRLISLSDQREQLKHDLLQWKPSTSPFSDWLLKGKRRKQESGLRKLEMQIGVVRTERDQVTAELAAELKATEKTHATSFTMRIALCVIVSAVIVTILYSC